MPKLEQVPDDGPQRQDVAAADITDSLVGKSASFQEPLEKQHDYPWELDPASARRSVLAPASASDRQMA